jgi:hypothetical protein
VVPPGGSNEVCWRTLRQSEPERPVSGNGQARTHAATTRRRADAERLCTSARKVCSAAAKRSRALCTLQPCAARAPTVGGISARRIRRARAHGAESLGQAQRERRDVARARAASMPQCTGPATHAKPLHILLPKRCCSRRLASGLLPRGGARDCALTHLRHFTAHPCVASCGKRVWLFAVAALQSGMAAGGARPALSRVRANEGAAAVTQLCWRYGLRIPELDCAARAAPTATSVTQRGRFLGSSGVGVVLSSDNR